MKFAEDSLEVSYPRNPNLICHPTSPQHIAAEKLRPLFTPDLIPPQTPYAFQQ